MQVPYFFDILSIIPFILGILLFADTMKEILKPKKQGKKGYVFSGLGVSNVQERIQLAYGPDYGLQYDSDGNSFTTVTIRFPQHKQIDSLLSERRENNDKGTDCR